MPGSSSWDEVVDFLVVGSGAAGLTGAVIAHDHGARCLVIEKSASYGGATAISGGAIWVPLNDLMTEAGVRDSFAEALAYLEEATAGSSSTERLTRYLEEAPLMVRYLDKNSHVRFESVLGYPDYYPEAAGGSAGGRTIEPARFNAMELGDEFSRMRPLPHNYRMPFLSVRSQDVRMFITGGFPVYRFVFGSAFRYYTNLKARFKGLGNTRLTLGRALVGRLRLSLLDRDVPIFLNTQLRELVVENGRVAGVVAERDGEPLRIRADRGVLLAAGGFEKNAEMRRRYQPAPIGAEWTAGPDPNVGDTMAISETIGASFDLLDDAWWAPVMRGPDEDAPRVMVIEKGLPGGMIVNGLGERYMNEAAPYNDVVKSMYAANRPDAPTMPSYLIFDSTFRKRYPIGSVEPSYSTPDSKLSPEQRKFITIDDTLTGLAGKIGVDPERLTKSVSRQNDFARKGDDLDFGRGRSLQDRYYGDSRVGPNPCLAPIEKPPFYSVEVQAGDLGTKGGLRTNPDARVLRGDDTLIEGLYASGNCSASVMGTTYPGAGGTIGPAMTFAWVAARHALGADQEPMGNEN